MMNAKEFPMKKVARVITASTPELLTYLDRIVESFDRFNTKKDNPILQEITDRFCNSLKVEVGSKYIKVVVNDSVHSFIVIKHTTKFNAGDVLMARTFKSPATNFARGNILTRFYPTLSWTGV